MRILNVDSDKSIDEVIVYLTLDEAKELRDKLEILISSPAEQHEHVMDVSIEPMKELTIAVYIKENMGMFDARSRQLIEENK